MSKKHHEDLLDSMINYAGHEILAQTAENAPAKKEVKGFMGDTGALDKRMQKVFRKHLSKRRWHKTGKILFRVAAVIVVLMIVSAIAIASSEALRARFLNLFQSSTDISTEIEITDEYLEVPEVIVEPAYLPEGYELVETIESAGVFFSKYADAHNKTFRIEQYNTNTEMSLNTEHINYSRIEIGGKEAYITSGQDEKNLQFYSNEYSFSIFGDLSIDEMIRIAESMVG